MLKSRHRAIGLLFLLGIAASYAAESAKSSKTDASMASLPGGVFESVVPVAPNQTQARVTAFDLDIATVSNAQFVAFVKTHPEWRRDRISALFADQKYLAHWSGPDSVTAAVAKQPVTHVSWYAARAYCESQGKRLPTWYEWEFAAAADRTRPDARSDAAWRQQILDWYSRPNGALPNSGASPANYYGVRDLHGVVWEWVEDFNGVLVSGDNREQGDPNTTRFCGSGALTLQQKDQYAIFMRIAMLTSLQAKYTTEGVGFRCAK